MLYVPKLLNNKNVFKRLNTVMTERGNYPNIDTKIGHFLYRVTCIIVSIDRMKKAQETTLYLVNEYKRQLIFGHDKRIALSTESLFDIYSQIPSALAQIVVMQNQILRIIQDILGIKEGVPKSLNQAMKKGLTTYGYTQEIENLFKEYWDNGGKYLRDIRDINEHYTALVDQTFIEHKNGISKVLIFFPDNPNEKSIEKFTYKKEINAIDAIEDGLSKLNNLVETILENLDIRPQEFGNHLGLRQMGEITNKEERTLGLLLSTEGVEEGENGLEVKLQAVEIKAVIPKEEGGGNVAARNLNPDRMVFND